MMDESKQLELPLEPESEQQERQRVWKASQTTEHLTAEARDYVTLAWSMRMAAAIEHLPPNPSKERIAGTLRHQGSLQEIVLFLDHVGKQRCPCRREFEEVHEKPWEVNWTEQDDNHKAECIPAKARKLLTLLEGE